MGWTDHVIRPTDNMAAVNALWSKYREFDELLNSEVGCIVQVPLWK